MVGTTTAYGTTIVYTSETAFVAGTSYTFTITDLSTPLEPPCKLSSYIVKVGEAKGAYLGHSDDSQWTFEVADFVHDESLFLLKYDRKMASLKRGTYSAGVCIEIDGDEKFSKEITFSIDSKESGITTTPEKLVATLGAS